MSDINDPEKYEMATIVTKNSKSKHVEIQLELVPIKDCLSLRKDIILLFQCAQGIQEYIIAYLDDTKFLESYDELPKCSIELLNIKKINGF